MIRSIRQQLHKLLNITEQDDHATKLFNGALFTLIILNVFAVIIESTEPSSPLLRRSLTTFEDFSMLAFTVEYFARVWVCTLIPKFKKPISGRLRYMLTPLAILDLLAISPYWLTAVGVDLRFLRITRFFRLLKFARFARYNRALKRITRALASRKDELVISGLLMLIILLFASTLMYYAECDAQPKVFASIPATLWWGFVTFTTIGYGDAYPITPAGKIIGAIFGILGISVFALPTAIITAALLEQMQKPDKNTKE